MHAEGNGKPEPEQVLRATADERKELLDHYRDTTRAGGGITICMDIGAGVLPRRAGTTSSHASDVRGEGSTRANRRDHEELTMEPEADGPARPDH